MKIFMKISNICIIVLGILLVGVNTYLMIDNQMSFYLALVENFIIGIAVGDSIARESKQ